MKKKEAILADCLEAIESGRETLEACLARHPEYRDELRALLEITAGLRGLPVEAPPDFRARSSRALRNSMVEEVASGSRLRHLAPSLRGLSYLIIAVFVVIVMATGGIAYASQQSLPGDILYPVKTGTDNVRIAFTFNGKDKAYLKVSIADGRIDDVAREYDLKHEVHTDYLKDASSLMDGAIADISGQSTADITAFAGTLATSAIRQQAILDNLAAASSDDDDAIIYARDAAIRGTAIAETLHATPEYAQIKPSVLEPLEMRQFEISGVLRGIQNDTWDIGGIQLPGVVYPGDPPAIGTAVNMEGIYGYDGGIYVTRIGRLADVPATVQIAGYFGPDGESDVWNISGLDVPVGGTAPALSDDEYLTLVGTVGQEGRFEVHDVSRETESDETKLEGVLMSVNPDGTVTIRVAGKLVDLDISGATLRTQEKAPLTAANLVSVVGSRVKMKDLSRDSDGAITAGNVTVYLGWSEWEDGHDGDEDEGEHSRESGESSYEGGGASNELLSALGYPTPTVTAEEPAGGSHLEGDHSGDHHEDSGSGDHESDERTGENSHHDHDD